MSHPQPGAPRRSNRLIDEASPYLLQHAHNPVDWWPWSDSAIAEARRRDVPIFLSIGYSTCYWCHVMERESFESESIAAHMNDLFVCVKVDREQRPDLDDLYMAATQIMTGHGGWPMSVFLDPHTLRPFWCGTYFPPEPRPGMGSMPSFPQVLEGISGAWANQRDAVLQQAESLASAVTEHLAGATQPAPLGIESVQAAASGLLRMFDRTNGGFGAAPKFPQPVYLDLLLDLRRRAGDDSTRTALDQAIRHTLDRMAVGGLRDQVAGGFHRYSVDATWTVPHFEKMLYDNAMLAEIYARAGEAYDSGFYRHVARSTIDYVLREMTRRDASGRPLAFFTAQDAEVDHREGLNYLWTPHQVRDALTPEDADLAIRVYGLDRGPNFRDPHHPGEPASNVLRMDLVPDEIAVRFGMEHAAFAGRMARINRTLYEVRQQRKQPHLDDKAVLAWNALMLRALAASALTRPAHPDSERDIAIALDVARSLLRMMSAHDATLLRISRDGRAQTPAMLEDYAAMVHALVTLARAAGATPDADWAMLEARRLIAQAESLFGDGAGGFFDTRAGATDLFVRTRATYDGAMPAGTTLMALALADLAMMTRDASDIDRAIGALRAISAAIADNPVGTAVGTRALLTMLREPALAAGRLGYNATGRRVGIEGARASAGEVGATGMGLASGSPPGPDAGISRVNSDVTPVAPSSSVPSSYADGFTPVEVFAPDERVVVTRGVPAELRLLIRIAPGYHVVAAEPGEEALRIGLRGFRVDVVDAGSEGDATSRGGIAAFADYPPGREFKPSAAAGAILVYEGEFELPVVLEREEGDAAGARSDPTRDRDAAADPSPGVERGIGRSDARPILVVTFQACTQRECLKVMRLELDVALDLV